MARPRPSCCAWGLAERTDPEPRGGALLHRGEWKLNGEIDQRSYQLVSRNTQLDVLQFFVSEKKKCNQRRITKQ